MIKRLLLTLALLAVIFGGIFGWKYYQTQQILAKISQPRPPATISSTIVTAEKWRPTLKAVGSLVAAQGVFVNNEVPGQVREILFESGKPIKAGEVLLKLEDGSDRAELEGLIAERRLAELQFERTSTLFDKRTVSRAKYDEAQAKQESAQARVVAQEALIKKKVIRAPFEGQLGIRRVDLGQYLAPGSNIVQLQQIDPIYADYSLPERYYDRISRRQKVELTVQAYPGRRFSGRIAAMNPGIEPGTRSIRVRAKLDNPDGSLRPGMFAHIETPLPERDNVLTVPRTAVTYNPYGDAVFVINERNEQLVAERRTIRTGEVRGKRVEVSEGLEVGERVVGAGHVKLRNGQVVQIDNTVKLEGGADSEKQ